jgi:hypothetical protein
MLATDFWRLAHYDRNGQPRLSERGTQYGIAAALLGELILSRHILVSDDSSRFVLAGVSTPPPGDAAGHLMLDELRAEQEHRHSVRTWIEYFGLKAPKWVANRLEILDMVKPERGSWLRGGKVTYVPTNKTEFAMPWGTLATYLRARRPLDYEPGCLAALAWATGLDGGLLDGAPPEAHQYLDYIVAHLDHSMSVLVHTTKSALADAAMTSR